MQYTLLAVGPLGVNCAILHGTAPGAWVLDPGADAVRILRALDRLGRGVDRIILTHGHIDHISALDDLLKAFPRAAVAMHPADAAWAFDEINSFPPYNTVPERPAALSPLGEGDELGEAGDLKAVVLHTPGHSPGCICLKFENEGVLFTGDTLFAGSVGRTDLPGGSSATLARSLKRLAGLPGNCRVIPGHGPQTTLADECRRNPYLVRYATAGARHADQDAE